MKRANRFVLIFGAADALATYQHPEELVGQVTTTGITLWELVNQWGVLPPLPVTP